MYIFQICKDSQTLISTKYSPHTHLQVCIYILKGILKSPPTNIVIKSRSEKRMSQNVIIEKLFDMVSFVIIFVVENSYINEWEHSVICKYMVLGAEIFAPTSMINTVILFLTGITLKSNEPIVHNNKTTKASFELYYLN